MDHGQVIIKFLLRIIKDPTAFTRARRQKLGIPVLAQTERPDNIDGIVTALSQKYFALIDCTQCANCCRSLQTESKKSELHSIAKTLGQSIEAFEKQFISEG